MHLHMRATPGRILLAYYLLYSARRATQSHREFVTPCIQKQTEKQERKEKRKKSPKMRALIIRPGLLQSEATAQVRRSTGVFHAYGCTHLRDAPPVPNHCRDMMMMMQEPEP